MGDYKKRGKPFAGFLPEDIVEEILIRIPAEKLIELKVVCKSWNRLISDGKFVEAHLRHWKSRPAGLITNMKMSDQQSQRQRQRHCFLSFDLKNKDMKAYSFNLNLEDCISAFDGEISAGAASAEFRVLSSCDGLLLVCCRWSFHNSRFFVCNPITKLCTMLPYVLSDFDFCSWTLAYDSTIRKYKVFGLLVHDDTHQSQFGSMRDKCYAFTLGCSTSNNWRELPTCHSHWWISPTCVSANGKLHWVASFDYDDKSVQSYRYKKACLLSIDIATEEFKETPCPLPKSTCWDSFLEMNGCLYFVHPNKYNYPLIEVWALKDWDTMVWSMDHVITYDSILFFYRPSNFGAFWRETQTRCINMVDPLHSKLIIQHGEELVSYGLQCRELRQITVHGQGIIPFFNYRYQYAPFYTEHLHLAHVNSLVSWH